MQSRTRRQNRRTLGSLYNEVVRKQEIQYDNQEDMIRAMADPQKWENWLWETVDAYKAKYPGRNGFIQQLQIKDRFISTRMTLKWVARYSCPDPWHEQSAWFYDAKRDELEYLWTVPDPETCRLYIEHTGNIVPEEQWILDMVLKFKNGELKKRAQFLNGEKKDSVHIILNELPKNLIIS